MAQIRLNDTTANAIRERYHTLFANAFTPHVRYEQMPGSDERTAYAANSPPIGLGRSTKNWGASLK